MMGTTYAKWAQDDIVCMCWKRIINDIYID